MEFDLKQCVIRTAEERDREDLLRVVRGIWGGTDYLPRVMERWIAEPWFLVCEYRGHAIACLKMTLFPDKVLWFEGLRVMPKYQNHGLATLMNRHAFVIAERLQREGKVSSFEFCTYYLNVESLHLTQKLGFSIVEKFWQLNKRGVKAVAKPEILPLKSLDVFHSYGEYIPCAWQSVHHNPASLPFLKAHGKLFRTPRSLYYLGGLHEPHVHLLEAPHPDMKLDLPYLQYFFGSRKSYGIVVPPAFKESLPFLMGLGFHFWEKELADNMLILRM
jgi:N-acetylglutamate synthase-like GNAT family acetyltransferase